MGFPSKIQDAAILNLLLDNCDQYPYAEERRLFYVALTRAKKKRFLLLLIIKNPNLLWNSKNATVTNLNENNGNARYVAGNC